MRSALVAAAFVGGTLAGAACLLAVVFEMQGFGGPRDAGPRLGYLSALAGGLAAAVIAPCALWRWLIPTSAPHPATVATVTVATLSGALLVALAAR